MKKQGYTLAEVMITLGIIGVLAAIMLPMANKFKPDSTKVTYLNTYDTLVTTLNNITGNENIYPSISNNRNYSKNPLLNTSEATINDTTITAGSNKLCRVLSETLKTNQNNSDIVNACSDTYKTENADFTPDFLAKNGVQVMVSNVLPIFSDGIYYRTDIYIDIDGVEGNNCMYDADICPNPDRFKFFVGANGKIVPADPMGKHYLETRTNLKAQNDVTIDNTKITFPDDMKKNGTLSLKDLLKDNNNNPKINDLIQNGNFELEEGKQILQETDE